MSIENFITALENGNTSEAKSEFTGELRSRISDAIEARRPEIGASMSPQKAVDDEDL